MNIAKFAWILIVCGFMILVIYCNPHIGGVAGSMIIAGLGIGIWRATAGFALEGWEYE